MSRILRKENHCLWFCAQDRPVCLHYVPRTTFYPHHLITPRSSHKYLLQSGCIVGKGVSLQGLCWHIIQPALTFTLDLLGVPSTAALFL